MEQYLEPKLGIITLPLLKVSEANMLLTRIKERTDAWEPAHVYEPEAGVKLAQEKRTAFVSALIEGSDEATLIMSRIEEFIRPLIFKKWQRDFQKYSEIQLVRYEPGGFFEAHRDNGTRYEDRYFTVVCYLNDDYSGGETSFPEYEFAVAPEPGKAVVFPSNFLHKGNEVIEGTKYIAVIWMLDEPPI